jgi:hypothetical protein
MSQPSMQEMFDRMAIDDLHGRYLVALNWLDSETLASLFTDDGVLDWAGNVAQGRDVIRRSVIAMQGDFSRKEPAARAGLPNPSARHFITNKIIDIEGDRAHSLAFWIDLDEEKRRRWPDVGAFGHYDDTLVRTEEGWRFSRRTVVNEMAGQGKGPPPRPDWLKPPAWLKPGHEDGQNRKPDAEGEGA